MVEARVKDGQAFSTTDEDGSRYMAEAGDVVEVPERAIDNMSDVLEEFHGEVDATDAARELAEQHGIDLHEVEGSGTDGNIVKADVEELV